MKTLYLLRHAQKEEIVSQDDYDINLTQKGKEDIVKLAKKLLKKEVNPDLIIASPANRARQTAEVLAKELNYSKNIMFNEVIYQAFLNELNETITYTFDTVNSLLIVGHNPSLAALAYTFCGFKEPFDMGDIIRIDFNCNSWMEIGKHNASFNFFEKP